MASYIRGFEYDIFISYRQKDNKGDRWVSEFVDALKTELESTFKEEITVYFDINPYDGLLETHDVNDSLRDKLNCLIFIPIISRTYCDPKSFAWKHEFKAFIEQASADKYGLKVRLLNGNVANRVLPVRIYDLNIADTELYESTLGGALRGVDFIYKSPGVNRPLLADEDHPMDNLNKTYYRDQVNKVANAIEEIIAGLKIELISYDKEDPLLKETEKEVIKKKREIGDNLLKRKRIKFLSGLLITTIVIFSSILVYIKAFRRDTLDSLRASDGRISVAVMPFQNMTNDTTLNIWQEGIQAVLINSLSNYSEDLKVRQAESISSMIQSKNLDNYALLTQSVAGTISQKLDAKVCINGNFQITGIQIRINAQLIFSKTQEIFKSFQEEGNIEKILSVVDSLSSKINSFLIISKYRKDVYFDYHHFSSESTGNPEAYKYLIYGQRANWERDYPAATDWYLKAIAADSNFYLAHLMLAFVYGDQGMYKEAKEWCLKACEKNDQMPLQYKILASSLHAWYFETPYEAIRYLKQLQNLDDQLPYSYFELGLAYIRIDQYNNAIPQFEKALELFKKLDLKPSFIEYYTLLGYSYHKTDMISREKKLYKKAELQFSDNSLLKYRQTILSLSEGDTATANKQLDKYILLCKENSFSDEGIQISLGDIFSEAGMPGKAERHYREASALAPDDPGANYNLAYFLIYNDRGIDEGLRLIEKNLELTPDDYLNSDLKGWGLFKQGKYKEALEILQKSWDLRMKYSIYDHLAYLHLDEAKKAAGQK